MKFGIVIGGFSSEMKEPKLHKLVYFEQIMAKVGAFLLRMVCWWVGNSAKNWYRESQSFKVRQADSHTILAKVPPLGPRMPGNLYKEWCAHLAMCIFTLSMCNCASRLLFLFSVQREKWICNTGDEAVMKIHKKIKIGILEISTFSAITSKV